MKAIVLTAALVSVIATPVFGQSTTPRQPKPVVNAAQQIGPGWAIARTPLDVVESGTYLGRDPDPQVRLELLRDYNSGGND